MRIVVPEGIGMAQCKEIPNRKSQRLLLLRGGKEVESGVTTMMVSVRNANFVIPGVLSI